MKLGNYRNLKLVYQRPEIRVPVEIILSVFASLFLIMTAIRPTLVTVVELKKKIEDQTLVKAKLNTKMNRLLQAKSQLELYEENLPLFEIAVPENYTYANLAKKIEILAAEKNIEIESLFFSSVVVSEGADKASSLKNNKKKEEEREWKDGNNIVKEFTVSFSVTAGETAVTSFLSDLESLDRTLLVSAVDITKVSSRESTGQELRASGKINGYYLITEELK